MEFNGIDIYNLPSLMIGNVLYKYDIFKINCIQNLKILTSKKFKDNREINLSTLDLIYLRNKNIFKKILKIGNYTIFNERIGLRLYDEEMIFKGIIYIKPIKRSNNTLKIKINYESKNCYKFINDFLYSNHYFYNKNIVKLCC